KYEALTEAWHLMCSFNFSEADLAIQDLQCNDPDDLEITEAGSVCGHWLRVFSDPGQAQDPEKLYVASQAFVFSPEWGPDLLRKVIIRKVLSISNKKHIAVFKNNTLVADLYIVLNDHRGAAAQLEKMVSADPQNSYLLARLADVQWEME